MRYMATYDLMETVRNTNQWLGATAYSMASYPIFALTPNPAFQWLAAWGEVTERTFQRMVAKPDWGIESITGEDGRDHLISIETVVILSIYNSALGLLRLKRNEHSALASC